MNSDIDDDIKEVLTLLNEKESFDNILIHHNIQLNIIHSQKKLEDIALIIDKEMKKIYNDIDSKLQRKDEEIKIEENIKKGCQLL
jgi:MinD-like ATPase involved in chromosome partitioning or flagellar assembly